MKDNHYYKWVLLTLVLAAAPSLFALPIWVTAIAFAGGTLPFIAPLRKKWYAKAAAFTLLAASCFGIWASFESLFSGKAVLSFFITVVFLKWSESRTRRDFLLLIFAAVILAAVGALYWENLLSMIHTFVIVLSLVISLIAIHADSSLLTKRFLFKTSMQLFILGMPLMVLLFTTFPRIPGPLWDIGLAFGLPLKALMDRSPGDHGKSMVLQPGGIQKASKQNDNVLVAEFEGAVPYKSQLYWRGAVFWEYDGETWTLPKNWDNRSRLLKNKIRLKELDKQLTMRANPVNYTLRVMENGGRWLYGLDIPAASAPEAFMSEDFQLLSIRKLVGKEPKFKMRGYLDYNVGLKITDDRRKRALAWPENTNPRLLALGKKIASEKNTTDEILHEVYEILADGKYQYDNSHVIDPGTDLLDRYFFDDKKGGSEYLAGSFVMLMRAAGVPARLVSGYRGGSIIALTNFVIVKSSDAHVWPEIWHDKKGWMRVEPKDIVLPPVKKAKTVANKAEKKTVNQITVQKAKSDTAPLQKRKSAKSKSEKSDEKGWEFPSFLSFFSSLQKWVINYNPERQTDLLESAGLEKSNWLDLLLGSAFGVFTLLATYFGLAKWFTRERLDPVTKTWKRFCKTLEKIGLEKLSQECPRDFKRRVCAEKPDLASAFEDIISKYIEIQYGGVRTAETVDNFKRQVDRFVGMI